MASVRGALEIFGDFGRYLGGAVLLLVAVVGLIVMVAVAIHAGLLDWF